MTSIRSAVAHPWARVIVFVVLGAVAMAVALLLSEPAGAADGALDPRPHVEGEPRHEGLVPVVAETAAGVAGTVEPITARAATLTDPAPEPVALAVDGVTPVAEQLAREAAPVVEATTTAVEPVSAPVVEAAVPVIAPVAATTAPLVEAVAPLTEAVAPVVGPVVEVAAPVVESFDPVLAPVVDSVDPITAPVVDAVEPIVAPVSTLGPVSTPTTAGDAKAAADSESAMSMPSTEASATEAIASAAAGPIESSDASTAATSASADRPFELLPASAPVERPEAPSDPAPVAPTGSGTDRSPTSGERAPTLQAVLAETAGAGGPIRHGVVVGSADALLWLEGRVLIFPG